MQVDVYPAFSSLYHEYFLGGLRLLYAERLVEAAPAGAESASALTTF